MRYLLVISAFLLAFLALSYHFSPDFEVVAIKQHSFLIDQSFLRTAINLSQGDLEEKLLAANYAYRASPHEIQISQPGFPSITAYADRQISVTFFKITADLFIHYPLISNDTRIEVSPYRGQTLINTVVYFRFFGRCPSGLQPFITERVHQVAEGILETHEPVIRRHVDFPRRNSYNLSLERRCINRPLVSSGSRNPA